MENIYELNVEDKLYPNILRKIKEKPKKLYAVGNIELLNEKIKKVAIVGSRKCTTYGQEQAIKFAKELSKEGICVVSGLAEGIDTFAHIGAVEGVGKTIAVLGNGFNKIFPKDNEWLFYKIIANNGCIITEYEENVEAESKYFPKRNRIVSGLSNAVLIIEAKEKSGSLITARIAQEQNKKLYAIPSNIDSKNGVGTNKLILNGVNMVIDSSKILNELLEEQHTNNKEKKQVKEEYKSVYNALSNNPVHVNQIAKSANMNISEVNTILTMLELEELIEQLPGNEYKLKE